MTTRQHLAWASGCCGEPAYIAPLAVGGEADWSQVFRVVCDAPPVEGECTSKSALWGYDAAPVLYQFARETALGVAHLWHTPPIVLRYLKTGDESIREAASAAAWDARNVASRGAGHAALDAARYATEGAPTKTAAWAAAWLVATSAAETAVGAARPSVWRRQNRRLAKLLESGRKLYGQQSLP